MQYWGGEQEEEPTEWEETQDRKGCDQITIPRMSWIKLSGAIKEKVNTNKEKKEARRQASSNAGKNMSALSCC